ncbi:MAG: DUF4912 domain-containing protein [Oscillatoriales cyanobacterium SM2_3_0]|nr:DUF4912 domain-containing protein [Oscillatoriales cyanobacterium SM2_3_0]
MAKERPPLEDMTLRQLRRVASEYGISRYSRMRKSQLLAEIQDIQRQRLGLIRSPMSEEQKAVEVADFLAQETQMRDLLASVDEGLNDLPSGYGVSRIVLMARDPEWAYAYWDVLREQKEELRRQGGQQLALRIYDVTDINLEFQSPHSIQEYPCDESSREWYVPIPVSDRDYVVEIGYRCADGRWLILARSESVRIPPIYPSDWIEDQFITVSWDDDLQGRKFVELEPPSRSPGIDPDKIFSKLFGVSREAEASRVAGSIFGSRHQIPIHEEVVSSYLFPADMGQWASGISEAAAGAGLTASGENLTTSGMGLTISGVGVTSSGTGLGQLISGVGRSTSGVGVTTSGLGLTISGLGPTASGANLTTSGMGLTISGVGLTSSGTGLTVSGMGLTTSGMGLTTSGMGLTISGMGLTTSGMGLSASGMGLTTSGMGLSASGIGAGWSLSGMGLTISGLGLMTSGRGVSASGMGLTTSGLGLTTSGRGLGVSGMGLTTSGVGVGQMMSGIGLTTSGVGLTTSGMGLTASGMGMTASGIGLTTSGVGVSQSMSGIGLAASGMGISQKASGSGLTTSGMGLTTSGVGVSRSMSGIGLTTSGVGVSRLGSGVGLTVSGAGLTTSGMGLTTSGVEAGWRVSGVGLTTSGMGSGVGLAASMPPLRPLKFWLIADAELIIYGATEPDAALTIAGQPIRLNPDGTFRFKMSFPDGLIEYPIVAVSSDGQQTRSIQMRFTRRTLERHTNTREAANLQWRNYNGAT